MLYVDWARGQTRSLFQARNLRELVQMLDDADITEDRIVRVEPVFVNHQPMPVTETSHHA